MDSRGWGLERIVKTRGKAFVLVIEIYIFIPKHTIELSLDPSLLNSNDCSLSARIFDRFSRKAQADSSRNRHILVVRFSMLNLEITIKLKEKDILYIYPSPIPQASRVLPQFGIIMDDRCHGEIANTTLTGVLGIEQLQIILLTTDLFSL